MITKDTRTNVSFTKYDINWLGLSHLWFSGGAGHQGDFAPFSGRHRKQQRTLWALWQPNEVFAHVVPSCPPLIALLAPAPPALPHPRTPNTKPPDKQRNSVSFLCTINIWVVLYIKYLWRWKMWWEKDIKWYRNTKKIPKQQGKISCFSMHSLEEGSEFLYTLIKKSQD